MRAKQVQRSEDLRTQCGSNLNPTPIPNRIRLGWASKYRASETSVSCVVVARKKRVEGGYVASAILIPDNHLDAAQLNAAQLRLKLASSETSVILIVGTTFARFTTKTIAWPEPSPSLAWP